MGVAGYFIDLAVRHPNKRDAFLLAIECDGATCRSSHSSIWSTDWFRDPNRETERIVTAIGKALR